MSLTIDGTALLGKIRDHYQDIQLLTMHCCSEISPEAIPEMIRERADLMSRIAAQERLLPEEFFTGEKSDEVKKIQEEITETIKKILSLDHQVEQVIQDNLGRIKKDLTVLYTTSRAASAYTSHSRH
jgi:hypothetical protein